MRSALFLFGSVVCAYGGASTAHAQSAPESGDSAPAPLDTVFLLDGSFVRGTLVEVVPQTMVRIRLATGEIMTIPWSQISRMDRASPPAAREPASAPPPQPPEPKHALVTVHLDAPRGVRLERRQTDAEPWKKVCSAPCDEDLPVDGDYHVVGEGVKTSDDFRLDARDAARVEIKVNAASKLWFEIGVGTAGAGLAAASAGAWFALTGALGNDSTGGDPQDKQVTTIGLVLLGVGAGVIALGALIAIPNWSTSVNTTALGASSESRNAAPRTTARLPVWRDERSLAPRSTSFPILTLSF